MIDKIEDVAIDDVDSDAFTNFLNAIKRYANRNEYDIRAIPYRVIDISVNYLKVCMEKLQSKESEILELRKLYVATTTPNSVADCVELYRKCAYEFRNEIIKENSLG